MFYCIFVHLKFHLMLSGIHTVHCSTIKETPESEIFYTFDKSLTKKTKKQWIFNF